MAYTPKQYAESFVGAVTRAQGKDVDVAIQRFIALMRKNSDWSRRKKIVERIEDEWRKKEGRSLATIVSARPLTVGDRQKIRERFPEDRYDLKEEVRPEIMAGVRIEIDRESQIDATLAGIFKKMFHK